MVARTLLASGFTVAVAGAAGRWFLIRTGAWDKLTRGDRPVAAFGVGAAWLSLTVFALCAAQLAYWPLLVGAGVAWLWAGLRAKGGEAAGEAATSTRVYWWFLPVALVYGGRYLVHALAPEISPDGVGYHLGLVARYAREHGFSRITTHMYAMLSQGTEMLFLFAFALGRHAAAKMVHFTFLVATVWGLLALGRRFGIPAAAATGAAFYAVSPVVGVDGTCAYNDCALAFVLFLMVYLLLVGAEELWPAIGVLAGFAFAIKYTAFLALPLALAWLWRRGWKAWWRVGLMASLFAVPWLVKNALVIGNPVAPFFNSVFENPYVHVSFERMYVLFMRHYGGLAEKNWSDYLRFPWEVAVAGGKLQGLLGPLFLGAPLGLLALRDKLGRRVLVVAVVLALPWLSNAGTRFLIPALVWIAVGMALGIWRMPRVVAAVLTAVLVAGHAVGSWPEAIEKWNKQYAWRLGPAPWRAALGLESEEKYLSRELPAYAVARMLDEKVPSGKRVFAPEGVPEAYTSREVLVSYQCAQCEVLMDELLTPVLEDYGPVRWVRFDWSSRELRGVRLVQTGSDERELWSLHEVLLFAGAQYVVPKPSWRIRARPNPWDGARALDGNPATRWRSWWPLYPGMHYQVDFPEPLRLSALEVHCSADQNQVQMKLEAQDALGRWLPLSAQTRRGERYAPQQEMRRLATLEVKAAGIDYILTDTEGQGMNLIGPHLAKDPGSWGLSLVGEYGPMRLYKIEAVSN
jgi:hypothetical protein